MASMDSNRRPVRLPIEPPASTFQFPPATSADAQGKVAVGGDFGPGTLLASYRSGLFPMRMHLTGGGQLAWWSPDPRAILTPDRLHISKSLRRSAHQYVIKVDTAFEAVIEGCAARAEGKYVWLTDEVREAYVLLHRLGWAHSVESWTVETPDEPSVLAGGLYGVAIGGLFSGESMFYRRPDASKVALMALVGMLRDDEQDGEGRLIDVQEITPHMVSLGAVEVSRDEYLARLEKALTLPLPAAFTAQTP